MEMVDSFRSYIEVTRNQFIGQLLEEIEQLKREQSLLERSEQSLVTIWTRRRCQVRISHKQRLINELTYSPMPLQPG